MKTIQDIIKEWANENATTENEAFNEQRYCGLIDGVTFALSTPELWREGYGKFAEWASERYTWVEGNKWDGDNDETYTTDELFDLYIQYLKTQP